MGLHVPNMIAVSQVAQRFPLTLPTVYNYNWVFVILFAQIKGTWIKKRTGITQLKVALPSDNALDITVDYLAPLPKPLKALQLTLDYFLLIMEAFHLNDSLKNMNTLADLVIIWFMLTDAARCDE